MLKRILCGVAVGVLATACSIRETRTVVVPAPADNSCVYYGYTPGTDAYRLCVEREADARRLGRVPSGYAEARMVQDSQDACVSYGLVRGTDRYDRCVQREITYRRPA